MEDDSKKDLNLQLMFWEIQSKDEADYIIKKTAHLFLIIGGIQLLFGFLAFLMFLFMGAFFVYFLVDGIIICILGVLLVRLKSRIVAIIMVLFTVITVVFTVIDWTGVGESGMNLFLALLLLYMAIASVFATNNYDKLEG